MSRWTEIDHDLAGENHLINEYLKKMEGKTVKNVRWGTLAKRKRAHQTDLLHIEFTDGDIFAIDTGSNVADPAFKSKIKPEDVVIHLLFRWKSDTQDS